MILDAIAIDDIFDNSITRDYFNFDDNLTTIDGNIHKWCTILQKSAYNESIV